MRVSDKRLELRSEPTDLFVFDFVSTRYCAPAQTSVVLRSTGGEVSGIAQWIALDLDEVTRYENRPGLAVQSAWFPLFYPLPQSIHTTTGQEIRMFGAHDREKLLFWA